MGWRHSLLAGALLLNPLVALAEEQPAEQWVQKMLAASRQASFQGQSVLVSGGKITSLSIYHAPVEDEVWERVVHMSGDHAEILRKGSVIACLHPGGMSRFDVGRSPIGRLSALEESAQSISRYYRFSRAGQERIAGHNGVRVDVEPLDSHRFGYSLWLDEDSGVLLKSQTNPSEGDPLEVFEFVSVTIGSPVPRSAFEPAQELQDTALLLTAAGAGGPAPEPVEPRWEAAWLPDGFRQARRTIARVDKPDRSARVFTDGLAAFTVFYEPLESHNQEATRSHGATVAVNRILQDKGALVTVVGEIPLATAIKIADNIKLLEASP